MLSSSFSASLAWCVARAALVASSRRALSGAARGCPEPTPTRAASTLWAFAPSRLAAHELDADKLAAVSYPYTALSLRLQEAFGLRREESIKLRPTWADRGDALHLKASWTKGGKERDVPIRTEAQRELLQDAKMLAGAGSLIPADISYRDQLNRFKAQTAQAGIDRVHGLRHHYAQTRYTELTAGRRRLRAGLPRND